MTAAWLDGDAPQLADGAWSMSGCRSGARVRRDYVALGVIGNIATLAPQRESWPAVRVRA